MTSVFSDAVAVASSCARGLVLEGSSFVDIFLLVNVGWGAAWHEDICNITCLTWIIPH